MADRLTRLKYRFVVKTNEQRSYFEVFDRKEHQRIGNRVSSHEEAQAIREDCILSALNESREGKPLTNLPSITRYSTFAKEVSQ